MRRIEAPLAFLIVFLILISPTFAQEESAEPTKKYVELTIRGALVETKPAFAFGVPAKTLRSLTTRLDQLSKDDEVTGVLLKIDGLSVGWAKLQELRDKIIQLRGSGKQVISYLHDGNNAEYLLACATDRIVLMPAGGIGLTGLRSEVMFYKGLLEKLDIEADMLSVGKYKSAVEPYTRGNMSEAQREAINAILDDFYEQQVEMIADGREDIDKATAERLIDRGPFTAEEAHAAKLVDSLQYYDELVKSVEAEEPGKIQVVAESKKKRQQTQQLTGFAGFMKIFSMLASPPKTAAQRGKPQIALIHAVGPIMMSAGDDLFSSGQVITPGKFVKALRDARENSSIRAVVLRVDSPGGSAVASDLIWREVLLTQREKPVVVSMSNVAASGGYYIAMAAGTIVAQPGTITGSIGVLGGKLNLKGLYNKLGLTKEIVTRGKNATLYSDYGKFTPTERERVEKMMEATYRDFVEKAAKGRNKTYDGIHNIAQGRIWTGKQAQTIGLVDELGGLDTAIELAKKRIGLSTDAVVDIIELPKPKTFLELLMEDMEPDASLQLTPDFAIPTSVARSILNLDWQQSWMPLCLIHLFADAPVAAILPFEMTIR
jgi:protease IV